MSAGNWTRTWWRLIQKDLLRERRSRRVWPGMLLLGLVLVLVLQMQMDLPPESQQRVMGGLFWVAAFFAGVLSLDRSFSVEREDGCWRALLLYPVSPGSIYLAKLAVNVAALACLECVLLPVFWVLSGTPPPARPDILVLAALLADVGFAAVGVLLSALTSGLKDRGNLLVLLLLPLVSPVVLGAAEATRFATTGDLGASGWRWIQLLACFAILFTTMGAIAFEYVMED